MRDAICAVYPNDAWKRKVANMDDNQVYAVYHSFLERGVFDKAKQNKKEVSVNVRTDVPQFEVWTGEQLSFW
jgi:hypothetical protein